MNYLQNLHLQMYIKDFGYQNFNGGQMVDTDFLY
jgi:hypothetical protein